MARHDPSERYHISRKGKTWAILDSHKDNKIVARARSRKLAMVKAKELNSKTDKDADKSTTHKKKPKLGSGERFAALKAKLKDKGAKNPAALAASIGRKKYGKKKFQSLAAKGRKK